MTPPAAAPARLVRPVLWLLGALLLLSVGQHALVNFGASQAADAPLAWGPTSYAQALDVLNRDAARERGRVATDPAAWAPRESLAMVLHARGQLTGSHEDLAEAVEQADASRAVAPDGSGPVLARAIVSLSMHRNAAAAQEVARMPHFAMEPSPADLAEGRAILGDVAQYGGHYARAAALYREALALAPGAGAQMRLAEWHRHRGEFGETRRLLQQVLAQPAQTTPWTRASLLLQLGAIDLQTGRWAAAEDRFRQADHAFPGWWLVQANLAQMAAVRGDLARAEQLYRRAMAGAERPSVMEGLANVQAARGKGGAASALKARARALWTQRLATYPEAYADHAFEAALQADDPVQAHRLAAINFRARPYGDAKIGLARAEAALGHQALARQMLQQVERTGWRSGELYVALANVCRELDDRHCWMHARRAAERINPHAFDERAALLAFGTH